MTAPHIAITLTLILTLAVCGYELARVRKVRTREIDRLADKFNRVSERQGFPERLP